MRPLPASFFARDAESVAYDLLGCQLFSRVGGAVTGGPIVEVEAYLGAEDPAAHCYGGRRTERTEPMFGPPGTAYVYFTYGMHWCLNAVTRPRGEASAVLIRAIEPTQGVVKMRERRGDIRERALCSGPAKLCQALGVDGNLNRHRLNQGLLKIVGPSGPRDFEVGTGPRIGITKAVDWPLRFTVKGSPWLSRRS